MESTVTFEVGAAVKAGWELTKKNWKMVAAYALFMIGISIVVSLLQSMVGKGSSLSGLIAFIGNVVQMMLGLIWIRLALMMVDGKPTTYNDFAWFDVGLLVKYFVASIVFGFAIMIGLIFFVIPGIIIALMWGQFAFLLVDRNVGIMESLKVSGQITSGYKMKLFLLGFVEMLLVMLGLLVLFVGVFVALPVVAFMSAWVYRQLSTRLDGQVATAPAKVAAVAPAAK